MDFASLFTAFQDLTSQQEYLLADENLAAIRWTLTGTMTDSLWGMPATNKLFKIIGIDILQIKDGKIVRDWGGMADQFPKMFKQLGLES